jgi:serine/threonine protein kinase
MSSYNSAFRSLSDSAIESGLVADDRSDLITLLAAIQAANINILSMTWDSARQPISIGGTSYINESLINLQASFAFKCVREEHKIQKRESDIFRAITTEITVLTYPSIQTHPNIVKLEGVCWDIPSEDEVWPVLIFEKTEFGDLHNFLTLPIGRSLSLPKRLHLCTNIATAIRHMHDSSRLI